MTIQETVLDYRTKAGLTVEGFSTLFGVAPSTVQSWEEGTALPTGEELRRIIDYFDGALTSLKPRYESLYVWEFYPAAIMVELEQSLWEGLDVEQYRDLFAAVDKLPNDGNKAKLGDVLFELIRNAKMRADYPYTEPSDLAGIRAYRKPYPLSGKVDRAGLEEKIHGAWMGRISGCMLGKTVECIRTDELVPFLKETGNYPMHRYIYRTDLNEEILAKYKFNFARRAYADEIDGMPVDDDTNYVVLAQQVIAQYGRDFTPKDMSQAWLEYQPKTAYCTAEQVAYCNFVRGYEPPQSAIYRNPYREWIGAQIRGDYFGYINPGNPELAAEMAWRDASISHVKNGIYGEMFVAAMLAAAAVTNNLEEIILAGLAEIPQTSRLYEDVMWVVENWRKGMAEEACFAGIHEKYDEYSENGWCYTNSNAMIVAAALLYGNGDYGKSICLAVQTGFDTDCNGATVGSVFGMANGIGSIPEYWTERIHDKLYTSICSIGAVKISDRVKLTMEHLAE